MKKIIASSIFVLFLAASILAEGTNPPPSILGIKLGMKEEKVRKLLRKIGKQQKEEKKEEEEEGGEEEIWMLTDDPNYGSLIVGFDRKHLVRYVSVFAAEKNCNVKYSDLGDLKKARLESNTNNYRYTWDIPAAGKNPRYLAIARGTDAQFLSSYSIKKF